MRRIVIAGLVAAGLMVGHAAPATAFAPWTGVSRPLSAYKAHAVRTAARIIAVCQRHCGYSGHLDANRLAGYFGFHHAFDPAGGDSQLIFYDLGRSLCADPDPPGEPGGLPAALPDVLDPNWWPQLLRTHEQRLAGNLRRAYEARAADTPDDFARWNPLLDAAGELGEVYGARLAAEDVTGVLEVRACAGEPGLRPVLEALAALGGLTAARHWSGSLLAARSLQPHDLPALAEGVDRLCDRLLPHLPQLEEAFGYPQDVVGSPLGAADYTGALDASLTWNRAATHPGATT